MACTWKTKYRFRAPGSSFWRAVVTDWPTVLKLEKWRMENPAKDLWEVRFFFSTWEGCFLLLVDARYGGGRTPPAALLVAQ